MIFANLCLEICDTQIHTHAQAHQQQQLNLTDHFAFDSQLPFVFYLLPQRYYVCASDCDNMGYIHTICKSHPQIFSLVYNFVWIVNIHAYGFGG